MQHESCTDLLAALSAFLDGEASAELCDEIERHLSDCSDCRVVVDTLRKTVLLYRQLSQPPLSPEALKRLYKRLNLEPFLAS